VAAMSSPADDVRAGRFPDDDEAYHLSDDALGAIGDLTMASALEAAAGEGAAVLRGAEPRTA
jgi:hypothetical protein